MIKGTIADRIEYETIIKSPGLHPSLYSIYRNLMRLNRWYNWRMDKGVKLDSFETSVYYFIGLMAESCKISNVALKWVFFEYLPTLINRIPDTAPLYYISNIELSEVFLFYPKQVLQTTLISAEVSNETIYKAIEAHKNGDLDELAEIIKDISLNKLFAPYQTLSYFKCVLDTLEGVEFKDSLFRTLKYMESDILDTLRQYDDNNHIPGLLMPKLDNRYSIIERRFNKFIDRIENEDDDAIATFIKFINYLIYLIYEFLSERLGKTDPIIKRMDELINQTTIYGIIDEFYPIKETDVEHFNEFLSFIASDMPIGENEPDVGIIKDEICQTTKDKDNIIPFGRPQVLYNQCVILGDLVATNKVYHLAIEILYDLLLNNTVPYPGVSSRIDEKFLCAKEDFAFLMDDELGYSKVPKSQPVIDWTGGGSGQKSGFIRALASEDLGKDQYDVNYTHIKVGTQALRNTFNIGTTENKVSEKKKDAGYINATKNWIRTLRQIGIIAKEQYLKTTTT